jgi:hypothetical protein
MSRKTATTKDGRTVEFIYVDDPPSGGMKATYFSPDRSYVVQFFHDQATANDPNRLKRLEAVVGKYNPTNDPKNGDYWKRLFCWPTAIVVKPTVGIVAPCYPSYFFFESGPFKGKEKEGRWFSSPKLRNLLPERERGTWVNYFQICILIARAVRRLHVAGLAHSDLSCKNILVDPSRGLSVVIDIDSLVVPQHFPPDVMGTPGYIAPEVLATQHLPLNDPKRKHPNAQTDQHALAVLVYEYLLFRHPLKGPKVNSTASAEEDELLSMGAKALFVEHPSDTSNRPPDIKVPCSALGPQLHELFMKSFVKGLHSPNDRPAAIDWERALIRTWDMLVPCPNANCYQKWFVLYDTKKPQCPFCGARAKGTIPVLKLRKQVRPGQWLPDGQLAVHNNGLYLFKWHVFDNVFPGEDADRTPQAYFALHEGRWLLINQQLDSLTSPGGNRVPANQAVELKHGAHIRLSQDDRGRIAEVQMVTI